MIDYRIIRNATNVNVFMLDLCCQCVHVVLCLCCGSKYSVFGLKSFNKTSLIFYFYDKSEIKENKN